MIVPSRERAPESAKSAESTDDRVAVGPCTSSPSGVVARVAGHTFLPSLMGLAPVVLDIGANQGQFTRTMIQKFGCRVHAVEPNPHLCANLQELAIPGVTVYGVALADTRGPHLFRLMNNSESSHFCTPDNSIEGVVQVEAVTLEDLISEIPDAGIGLVKMDVEGAEIDVLERVPARALERVKQLTVEFHQFMYPESRVRIEAVKKRFTDSGYWVVDFSRTNYDVLFVHPNVRPSPYIRALIQCEKYKLRVGRRLSSRFGP
jgi:FkbM family methyltransferase